LLLTSSDKDNKDLRTVHTDQARCNGFSKWRR